MKIYCHMSHIGVQARHEQTMIYLMVCCIVTDLQYFILNVFTLQPEVIASLTRLQELWVDNNRLTCLPKVITSLFTLLLYLSVCHKYWYLIV